MNYTNEQLVQVIKNLAQQIANLNTFHHFTNWGKK